jgi:hypothetical protein
MNLSYLALGAFALSLSIVIDADAPPTPQGSSTTATVAGGAGHYAIIDRGCEGEVLRVRHVQFDDRAADIEHRFANGLTLGLKGGLVNERAIGDSTQRSYIYPAGAPAGELTNTYLNPNVGWDGRKFGIGGGWIHAQRRFELYQSRTQIDPSFHVRFGSRAGSYFRIAYMENVPLFSSGGYLDIGFGLHPTRDLDAYAGLSTVPFDRPGLTLRMAYRVLPQWALSARGRVGFSNEATENGIALGLTFTTEPALAPEPPPSH